MSMLNNTYNFALYFCYMYINSKEGEPPYDGGSPFSCFNSYFIC